jgi:hypothetical protein
MKTRGIAPNYNNHTSNIQKILFTVIGSKIENRKFIETLFRQLNQSTKTELRKKDYWGDYKKIIIEQAKVKSIMTN